MLLLEVTSTSTEIASLSPPTVSRAAPACTSPATTLAPSSANRRAVARPIPEPAPVTNATLPARRAVSATVYIMRDTWPFGQPAWATCATVQGSSMAAGHECKPAMSEGRRPSVKREQPDRRTAGGLPECSTDWSGCVARTGSRRSGARRHAAEAGPVEVFSGGGELLGVLKPPPSDVDPPREPDPAFF